jgi:hypothetical protein
MHFRRITELRLQSQVGSLKRNNSMRLALSFLIFGLGPLACGCQSEQTQRWTNKLVTTVPALYYQQVLDNLAMTIARPGSLPFFCLPTQGSNVNTLQLNASYSPEWDLITSTSAVNSFIGNWLFDKQTAGFGGQISNAQSFQLQPVTDPDKLALIQIALRLTAGEPISQSERHVLDSYYQLRNDTIPLYYYYYYAITGECLQTVKSTCDKVSSPQTCTPPKCPSDPTDTKVCVPQASWFVVSRRWRDVPRTACFVGHCCDVWVWVPPEFQRELTAYTLAILDISSIGAPLTFHASQKAHEASGLADIRRKRKIETNAKTFVTLTLKPAIEAELKATGLTGDQLKAAVENKLAEETRLVTNLFEAMTPEPQAAPEPPPEAQPLFPSRLTPFPYPSPPQ